MWETYRVLDGEVGELEGSRVVHESDYMSVDDHAYTLTGQTDKDSSKR